MKTKLLLLIVPALLCADNLNSFTQMSKQKDVESSQSAYYPTIDTGASYSRYDDRSKNSPGDIYNAYAKVGMDLYDGEYKHNTIKQNKKLLSSVKYSSSSYKKGLQLQIVKDFFNIKSAKSTLNALKDKEVQLLAELDRVQKFFDVGSATIDEIDRLKAEYNDNLYQIDHVKYQIISLKRLLSIKIGKKVTSIENSCVQSPQDMSNETSDAILALQANASSLTYGAKTVSSAYLPQVRLEDTYSLYGYGRDDATHPKGLDNQNILMLTVNMRLFDRGTISKQKESILLREKALQKEIEYSKDEQNTNIELASLQIDTTKAQIKSAKSSLDSAQSAYKTISEKYSVGAVDNVTYLDALSIQTNAKAQYETALNNLQINYASYYYYTNKNIKEYITCQN